MTRQEHLAWCKERALEYACTVDIILKTKDAFDSTLTHLRNKVETA